MSEYEEEKELLEELKNSQSWVSLLLCSIFGCIPAVVATYMLVGERVLIIMWVIPGLIVGLLVKFGAQPYLAKMRVIPALMLFILICAMGVILPVTPLIYLLALTNAVVVLMLSKRSLTKNQERALWLEKQGKIVS